MKKIIVAVSLTLALAAAGTAAAKNIRPHHVITEEPCIGLGCWPTSAPMKHARAHRETLPPVW
jgi:hypothetical protein